MSKPKFHHVNLKTTRPSEMIDWYGKVLGMTVNHQAPVGAWLSNDEANHRLALIAFPWIRDDAAKEAHTGLHHIAFEFATFAELFDNYARVRELGVTPRFCLDHGMTTSMYYADPDGNYVEVQVDNFGDWAKSTEWMRTSPEFAANPIGVFFDPAAVHDAYRAGRKPSELHEAIVAQTFLPDPVPVLGPPVEVGDRVVS
jgi:catechol-2,3-dioxygenase